jgi:hypothetical protein
MARRVGDAQDGATCRAPSVGGALCAAIEELKETFLRWIESEKLPSGRGVSADELPEAAPVVPPEKTLKEPSKRHPRPKNAARKLQRQTVVLPPKKTADPRFHGGGEAGRGTEGQSAPSQPTPRWLPSRWPEAPPPGRFSR